MFDDPYTHCIAVRCLEPKDGEDDERNFFIRRFETYMQYTLGTGEYEFQEVSEERDDTGIYFDYTIWTKVALDEEDKAQILLWDEVINAHLNIEQGSIEMFP